MPLVIGLWCLVLAGCGNNPYPRGQTAEAVLYRSMTDNPRTLDPSVSYTVSEARIIDVIYPSYFRYHYLKRDPYVLELMLGAEEPIREPYALMVTEDGRQVKKTVERWSFRIRQGLRFQDDPCFPGGKGREIIAADFLYAFRRMADPKVPCPVRSFVDDKILGFGEYVAHNQELAEKGQDADYHAEVPGLRLDPDDPYRFEILFSQPYPQLRYLMAMHFTTPIAHEAAEHYGKELARHPVGSGAYVMSEYLPKQRIVLTVNPNRPEERYPSEGAVGDEEAGLLADAGKRLPLADRIVFTFNKESVTGWNLFLQGYMDAWGVGRDNYRQVMSQQGQLSEEMVEKGVSLHRAADPNIRYFAFNMKDAVVGGQTQRARKLRQAISTALDSQEFIDLFLQGNGRPAQWIIPPGLFGYDPEFKNPYSQHSVERAKQLLAEAGYPDGIDPATGDRLVIYNDNTAISAAGRQFVGVLKKQIERIGIKLESRSWRPIVWQDRIDKGQFQFASYGWLADYPDPENFVFLLYGQNRRPGPNAAAYDNPEYNRLFEQMRSMDDSPERLAIIHRMRKLSVEDCPWVYLYHGEGLFITYDWLTNVKPHPVANDTTKYFGIRGEERANRQVAWNRPNYLPGIILVVLWVAGAVPAVAVVRNRRRRRVRKTE